jgi:hypothetical protein
MKRLSLVSQVFSYSATSYLGLDSYLFFFPSRNLLTYFLFHY